MSTTSRLPTRTMVMLLLLTLLATALSACSAARAIRYAAFPETEEYLVGSGDTIYSIAFQHELDYRDLARWNHLQEPYKLHVGQQLVLNPYRSLGEDNDSDDQSQGGDEDEGTVRTAAAPPRQVTTTRPLPPPSQPQISAVPAPAGSSTSDTGATGNATGTANAGNAGTVPKTSPGPGTKPPTQVAIAEPPKIISKPPPPPPDYPASAWVWPADGKVVAAQAPGGLERKGVDILGKVGDPIRAAHGGRVVYAGTGLKGYGHMLIIKHDSIYLSAYAHNSQLLVKEGDTVKTGQVIARMGLGPKNEPQLYFELRREGKPVAPTTKLPKR